MCEFVAPCVHVFPYPRVHVLYCALYPRVCVLCRVPACACCVPVCASCDPVCAYCDPVCAHLPSHGMVAWLNQQHNRRVVKVRSSRLD